MRTAESYADELMLTVKDVELLSARTSAEIRRLIITGYNNGMAEALECAEIATAKAGGDADPVRRLAEVFGRRVVDQFILRTTGVVRQ